MDRKKQTPAGGRGSGKSQRTGSGTAAGRRQGSGDERHSQRAYIRQLRAEQAVRQEQEENWRRKGFPLWARMLIAVAAVLLILLVFFRVEEFEVSGNVRYTAQEVANASGVTNGDVLMSVNKTRAASRILVKLPYIRQVTVSKMLPGTVRYEVEECKAQVAAESEFGAIWLMNGDGKLLEKLPDGETTVLPLIQGVTLDLPNAGDPAVFTGELQGQRAMEVARALEEAELSSVVRIIDVSDPEDMILSYDDRIEVYIGDGTDVDYRLQYMIGAIARLDGSAKGSLDLSFQEGNHAVFHPMITEAEEARRARQEAGASEDEAAEEEAEDGETSEDTGEDGGLFAEEYPEEDTQDDQEDYEGA